MLDFGSLSASVQPESRKTGRQSMDLRQIRSFIVLAEELHFGRAASRLHIAQPALTQQLKSLEQELQVQLLFRSKREVRLTPAGQSFLRNAKLLIEQAQLTVSQAQQVHRGEHGSISIGYTPLALFCVLPELLNRLRDRVPNVHPDLIQMTASEQEEALRVGRINAGLLQTPLEDPTIAVEHIQTLEYIAVVPAHHPLASKHRLRPSDFKNQPLVIPSHQVAPRIRDELTAMCAEAGFEPHFVAESSPAQSLISLVAAGIGIGFIAAPFKRFARNGVVFKTIEGPLPSISIAIAVRADDQSAITATLLAVARQHDRFLDI
jgi:DNA-binding transcriptional LysR family regulator